ncbi:MAG: homocysteine S-methyltransferase [Spirochaetales bacterium]|nr:homocysteine S-methyltransferase [Spirochaetales bacterium]
MNPIQSILETYSMMILDGAFATELEHRGCDLNDPLWSAKVLMENPEIIGKVHTDYYNAGADCVITASYQATYEGFEKRGLSGKEAEELIQLSVRIAAEARDSFWAETRNRKGRPKPLVAASVGPYGAFLADGSEYRGNYGLTVDELMNFHRKRLKTLIEAGPDILACETIPCLDEAKALTFLLEENPGVYTWISFSAKDGRHINSGEEISACAEWLNNHKQVAAVGINCTAPKYMESLVSEIKKSTDKPVILYPNSGEEYLPDSKTWNGASIVESYSESAQGWYKSGASIIGGCCRTKPSDIKEISLWARGGETSLRNLS